MSRTRSLQQKIRAIEATSILTVLLILTPITVAKATEQPNYSADEISHIVAAVAPTGNTVEPSGSADSGVIEYVANSIEVAIPATVDDAIVISAPGIDALSLGLPSDTGNNAVSVAADGTAVYSDPDGLTDVAVQVLEDSVRVSTILLTPSAPELYQYDLPEGTVAELLNDGSLLLTENGALVGSVAPPWAKDANGAVVPTRYETNARGFVQLVDHQGRGFAYPVVADPSYSYCTLGRWYPAMCVKYTRSETALAASVIAGGAGVGAIGAHLCTRAPNLAIRAACIGAVASLTWANISAITTAQRQGKCVSFAFSYPAVSSLLSGGFRVVNC